MPQESRGLVTRAGARSGKPAASESTNRHMSRLGTAYSGTNTKANLDPSSSPYIFKDLNNSSMRRNGRRSRQKNLKVFNEALRFCSGEISLQDAEEPSKNAQTTENLLGDHGHSHPMKIQDAVTAPPARKSQQALYSKH